MAPKSKVFVKFFSALKCASGSVKKTVSIEDLYNQEGLLKERWGTYTNLTEKHIRQDVGKSVLELIPPVIEVSEDDSLIDSINKSFELPSEEETLSDKSDPEPVVSVTEQVIPLVLVAPPVIEAVKKLIYVTKKPVKASVPVNLFEIIPFQTVRRTLYTIYEKDEPCEDEWNETGKYAKSSKIFYDDDADDKDDNISYDSDSEDEENMGVKGIVKPESAIVWEMTV